MDEDDDLVLEKCGKHKGRNDQINSFISYSLVKTDIIVLSDIRYFNFSPKGNFKFTFNGLTSEKLRDISKP